MAISGLNNYRDVLYQWQGQQLKSTGNSPSSSASRTTSSLFSSNVSMTQQISSMVELTRYAMDAMGVGRDGRVTFSQITKYREQLQSEFNDAMKKGISATGIRDIAALSFSIDKNAKITVSGGSESDRKKAQQLFDANPGWGKDLRAKLSEGGVAGETDVTFSVSSTGKLTVKNPVSQAVQAEMNERADLADTFRQAMDELGIDLGQGLQLMYNSEGAMIAASEHPQAARINEWLTENPEMGLELGRILAKQKVEKSSVSVFIATSGAPKTNVRDSELEDAQSALDGAKDLGSRMYSALSSQAIDPNISFSIRVNEDGTLDVLSDHPDADKIRQFFADNPELLKKYRQIETLAGIDDARKAMQISPSAMRKRIQVESMAAWWDGSGNASSFFGQYSGGGMSLFSGLNLNV